MWLSCPYLGADVELTDERVTHIRRRHDDVLAPEYSLIRETLTDPDVVRARPTAPDELLFVREFDSLVVDQHVIVVVRQDEPPDDRRAGRFWVITAYRSPDEPAMGRVEW